jgi:hypothetical protein
MSSLKSAATAALVYLRDNPGVVALIVGQVVLTAAHLGFKVNSTQLYEVGSALVPVLLAYFNVAKTASVKAGAPNAPTPTVTP